MDPTTRGPDEHGHASGRPDETGEDTARRRPSRDPLTPDLGQPPQRPRTVQLVSGDLLLTVNPVDGSEVEACPPGQQPPAPVRHTAAERADRESAGTPPVPPGPPLPQLPLLERQEDRERLVDLLTRGRSARVTAPPGAGRTTLLDAVAADCADLAPDGVVRLSGHKRTATDLLYGLFEAVQHAPLYRPDRAGLLEGVRGIGAVVVLDDLEFGGAALDELLDAAPESAFLLAAAPEVAPPGTEGRVEEIVLGGLGRAASLDLLERAVDRPLSEEERNWAGDLWFESEGLPLRFVQAGALLRQRDRLRAGAETFDEYNFFEDRPADAPVTSLVPPDDEVPLPSLGEGAAPAPLLASRLSRAARDTLHFAVALGGEVPHQAHLPALVGDTHADAALGELAACGLLSPAGPRYRLAAGVRVQLEAEGYGEDAGDRARTAAQHYAWWAGHPSVTPERAVAEADALLAAMTRLVPGGEAGQTSAAVLLARSAAPAFAAGLHWGVWERALRLGQEAARIAGEVAEEAYFHHELGVLALCTGSLDRARAELEASIAMRGALADKPGAVAGRRALALVADRSAGPALALAAPPVEDPPFVRYDESATPAAGVPTLLPFPEIKPFDADAALLGVGAVPPAPAVRKPHRGRRTLLGGARRNLVAACAGALLAAVLGTVVTLGATSGNKPPGGRPVTSEQSTEAGGDENGLPADATTDGTGPGGWGGHDGAPVAPGTSGEASPSETESGTPGPGASESGSTPTDEESPSGDVSASESPDDPSPTGSTSQDPGPSTSTSSGPGETPPTDPSTVPDPPTEPETSDSAIGPLPPSSSVTMTSEAPVPASQDTSASPESPDPVASAEEPAPTA
ncbi:ATP-binding protein [Streptomyces sp. DT171]|uniref:ATP-binding protein n=1 Tax=Streptomyces sp. DT171 TaxID=3416524 RepID=UPI003CF7407B